MNIGTQPNPFERMLAEIRTGLAGPGAVNTGGQSFDNASGETRGRLDRLSGQVRKAADAYNKLDQRDDTLHAAIKALEEQFEKIMATMAVGPRGPLEVTVEGGYGGQPKRYIVTPLNGGPRTEITVVRGYGGESTKYLVTPLDEEKS